jgi:energy-coupling factor transporter ATP-binding protein EcfA2
LCVVALWHGGGGGGGDGAAAGGMQRRLSLAISLIGSPRVLFLDEPTTGLDPETRRNVWQVIGDAKHGKVHSIPPPATCHLPLSWVSWDGARHLSDCRVFVTVQAIVLTTHSMEEADALCERIGIMATGRLRCVGSNQHLKNKFGNGYRVELTVCDAPAAKGFMQDLMPSAQVEDAVNGTLVYQVPYNWFLSRSFLKGKNMLAFFSRCLVKILWCLKFLLPCVVVAKKLVSQTGACSRQAWRKCSSKLRRNLNRLPILLKVV